LHVVKSIKHWLFTNFEIERDSVSTFYWREEWAEILFQLMIIDDHGKMSFIAEKIKYLIYCDCFHIFQLESKCFQSIWMTTWVMPNFSLDQIVKYQIPEFGIDFSLSKRWNILIIWKHQILIIHCVFFEKSFLKITKLKWKMIFNKGFNDKTDSILVNNCNRGNYQKWNKKESGEKWNWKTKNEKVWKCKEWGKLFI
jgi:hypothetical protein